MRRRIKMNLVYMASGILAGLVALGTTFLTVDMWRGRSDLADQGASCLLAALALFIWSVSIALVAYGFTGS
jgi:hypothetical protein